MAPKKKLEIPFHLRDKAGVHPVDELRDFAAKKKAEKDAIAAAAAAATPKEAG